MKVNKLKFKQSNLDDERDKRIEELEETLKDVLFISSMTFDLSSEEIHEQIKHTVKYVLGDKYEED